MLQGTAERAWSDPRMAPGRPQIDPKVASKGPQVIPNPPQRPAKRAADCVLLIAAGVGASELCAEARKMFLFFHKHVCLQGVGGVFQIREPPGKVAYVHRGHIEEHMTSSRYPSHCMP